MLSELKLLLSESCNDLLFAGIFLVFFLKYSLRVIAPVLCYRVLALGATETSLGVNVTGPCKNVFIKRYSQKHK